MSKDAKHLLSKGVQGPSSPSPSLVKAVIDEWVRVKQPKDDKSDVPSKTSPSRVPGCDKPTPEETIRESDTLLDLSCLAKYLPPDQSIISDCLTKVLRFYAKSGQLDRIAGLDPEHKLFDSWKNPELGSNKLQYQIWSGSAVPITTSGTFNASCIDPVFVSAGSVIPVSRLGAIPSQPFANNRQTNVVKMKHIQIKFIMSPTASFAAVAPATGLFTTQVWGEVVVFCDTMALLSNQVNGSAIPIRLYELSPNQQTIATDPNAIFIRANMSGGSLSLTNVVGQPTAMPSPLTHGSRFHILHHGKYDLNKISQAVNNTSGDFRVSPGNPVLHDITISPDVAMPFATATSLEPFMNSIYVLFYTNTSSSLGSATTAACDYQIKVEFEDVGQIGP